MDIFSVIIVIIVLVYSSILHEIAHGYTAYRLGDPTAKLMGRLSLNPIRHIDPFMSIILPVILFFTSPIIFGGAKPVPVDVFNLREGRKDMALVSLAGPITNVLLAILGSILIHILYPETALSIVRTSDIVGFVLYYLVFINLLLAVFNLLPIPPLDGSKIFSLILPKREAAAYLAMAPFGFLIIFFLLFVPMGPFSLMGFVVGLIGFSLSLLGF